MPSTLLSLIFLISPLLTTSTPITSPSSLIQSTCRATTNYSPCITTLSSNPGSRNANTSGDLTKVAIAASLSYATNTCSYILSISKSMPTARSSAFCTCAQRFVNACEALQRAVRALEEEEYDYVAVHVGAAREYPGMCRALFGGGTSPGEVSRMGMELEGLCQLDLDLVSLLNLTE